MICSWLFKDSKLCYIFFMYFHTICVKTGNYNLVINHVGTPVYNLLNAISPHNCPMDYSPKFKRLIDSGWCCENVLEVKEFVIVVVVHKTARFSQEKWSCETWVT